MVGIFPAEAEPDGAVFAPHHFYLGVVLILLVCWMARDPEAEAAPWGVAGLTLLSVFSFALTWPYYPAVGAAGVLVLLAVATVVALLRPFWWRYGLGSRGVLLAGLFLAWDDALSHAFGWWTPMDALWAQYLHPYVSDPYIPEGVRFPKEIPQDVELPRVVPSGVQLPGEERLLPDVRLPVTGRALPELRLPAVRLPVDAPLASGVRPPGDPGLLLHLEPLVAKNLGDALAVVPL
ncbi:hypothetical protein [Halorussus sp. AFM4]|uniref:hypothetical protein n=1 Tax=Halorussus sp. AFM4 TaxID=3421651 RepID=UPI003EB85F74